MIWVGLRRESQLFLDYLEEIRMRVKHYTGSVIDVPEAKAVKLASYGAWSLVDQPADKTLQEVASEALGLDPTDTLQRDAEAALELSEPQEDAKPAATIQEMRAWALKEGIEGVKEKGKLSRNAIEAYQEAHKEN